MIHLGDITKIHGNQIEPVHCIIFGSPCQDLSMAGLRLGFGGDRSVLFVDAVRIIGEMRRATNGMYPTFAVWENVPGAFSSNGGEDFRTVLEKLARVAQPDASIPRPSEEGRRWKHAGAIAGDGWSLAWRQLDAQHWGVPQRRKRIALVADFRGGRAAEILFERTGLPGNPDQSIPTWQSIAGLAQDSPAGHDRVVGERSYCISGNTVDRVTYQNGTGVRESGSFTVNTVDRHAVAYSINPLASNSMKSANPNSGFNETKVSRTLDCFDPNPAKNQGGLAIVQPYVLKIRSGCDGGGKGALVQTKRTMTLSTLQDQTLFQPVVFDARGNGDGITVPTITGDHESRVTDYTAIAVDLYNGAVTGDKAAPITCRSIGSHSGPQVAEQRTFSEQAYDSFKQSGSGGTLKGSGGAVGYGGESLVAEKMVRWIVRRLTPTECERLQGLPDGWTDIGEWIDTKGRVHKPADTPRYKALGNSIALPQWFWIVQKMRPYIGDGATMGSLFDGIGGFPLVWEATYGKGTARWASEIEEFPIAVTKKWFGSEEAKL